MYLESMVWLVSDMWIGGENTVHPDHWNCSPSKELLWPATDLRWTAWERNQEDHVYVSDSTVCLERVEWLVCHLWGSHAHKKNTVSIIVFVIGYCSPRKLSGKWYTLLWRSLESLHFQRSAFVGGRQVPSWRWSCWAFTNDRSLKYTFTQMCLQVSVFGLKLIKFDKFYLDYPSFLKVPCQFTDKRDSSERIFLFFRLYCQNICGGKFVILNAAYLRSSFIYVVIKPVFYSNQLSID